MIALWLALQAVAAPPPAPPGPPPAAPAPAPQLAPFHEMAEAIASRDIPRFKAAWHPEGWDHNLVGGSGLSGEAVAGQAKSEGWRLVPDPDTLAKHTEGPAWIVRAGVVAGDGRQVDAVHAVLVSHGGRWVVLGAGENPEQVMALADRAVHGKPFAPPPKGPPPPKEALPGPPPPPR
ncbi:MAG: hypothetical protein EP330_21590 [Deltaproteobacteria bacterium]|nr:MAG: hypothetical protein EP330_21590 [Deltaproteobacteria bacterium]